MSVRVEERLLIALAVNVYQKWAQFAQQRLGSELIVDEYLVAAAGGKFTPDNYLKRLASLILSVFAVLRVDNLNARFGKERLQFPTSSDRKKPFDESSLGARLEQVRCEPCADQHAERVNDD